MSTYKNADAHTRVWHNLTHPSGGTLRLEPGERVDLDLPDDFDDPHLVPVAARVRKVTVTEASPDEGGDQPPTSTESEGV